MCVAVSIFYFHVRLAAHQFSANIYHLLPSNIAISLPGLVLQLILLSEFVVLGLLSVLCHIHIFLLRLSVLFMSRVTYFPFVK